MTFSQTGPRNGPKTVKKIITGIGPRSGSRPKILADHPNDGKALSNPQSDSLTRGHRIVSGMAVAETRNKLPILSK